MTRQTTAKRATSAGCYTCHGEEPKWTGANAQGIAARHHDATGHTTWADVNMHVQYGRPQRDHSQLELEDAIAGATR